MDALDRARERLVGDGARRRRAGPPGVVAGTGDLQDPARHREVEAVGGQLLDEPEPYFGRMFSRAKYAEARPKDLDLGFQDPVLSAQFDQLALLSAGQAFLVATVGLVLRHPATQTRLADPEIAGGRCDRFTLRDKVQCSTPELRRLRCGHSWNSLPRRSSPQIRCPWKRVRLRSRLRSVRESRCWAGTCGCTPSSSGASA